MMETIAQFATDKRLIRLLIKERVKCCRKNAGQHNFAICPEASVDEQSVRKFLSTIMPPRALWSRPKRRNRFKQADKRLDTKKLNAQSVWMAIQRDRADQSSPHPYLQRLDAYVHHLQQLIASPDLAFHTPDLVALLKSTKCVGDHREMVFRPLSVYSHLDDKIILALVSRYLMQKFNKYLHPHILSYRCARPFGDEKHCVTDFNDGIKLIGSFRQLHQDDTIYASDCDIRKFYDTIHHDVIRDCFQRMFTSYGLSHEAQSQLMTVLNAYLRSFHFTSNVLQRSESAGFWRQACSRHHAQPDDVCRFDWLSNDEGKGCYGSLEAFREAQPQIGIPQGGALSLVIADVVLNDVDLSAGLPDAADSNRLFVRFCDDMILLHTSLPECQRLMQAYAQSLTAHRLVYHSFEQVPKCSSCATATGAVFWHQKSHSPYLWGDGDGNSNRYVGFLGYEMSRDGEVRLRRSNEEKFDDKFRRFYYSVCRQMDVDNACPPEVDELIQRIERGMQHMTASLSFYEGLRLFDCSSDQLLRLEHRRIAMVDRLLSRLQYFDRSFSTDYTPEQLAEICACLKTCQSPDKGFKVRFFGNT